MYDDYDYDDTNYNGCPDCGRDMCECHVFYDGYDDIDDLDDDFLAPPRIECWDCMSTSVCLCKEDEEQSAWDELMIDLEDERSMDWHGVWTKDLSPSQHALLVSEG